MRAALRMCAAVTILVALAGCTTQHPESPPPSPSPTATSTTPVAPPPSTGPFNQELHDELVAMLQRDQAPDGGGESSQTRTDRLEQIILEFGWPTIALVGDDGEEAAWAIAQHSDLDPEFQRFALEQLRKAVDVDQASPGNLAYLEDRVAAGAGEPQTYGTQMRCGPDGPEPATPIEDEAGLEQRRADAGLDPFADYLLEMTAICAEVPE
ncbi:DUF6624 domain-containing protein [Homoserinimonas sp. A447]